MSESAQYRTRKAVESQRRSRHDSHGGGTRAGVGGGGGVAVGELSRERDRSLAPAGQGAWIFGGIWASGDAIQVQHILLYKPCHLLTTILGIDE